MIQARRLQPVDAPLAAEAIRKIKKPEPGPAPGVAYFERFLARPENILIVAVDGREPAGFLLAYLLDRVDADQRMVCLYEIEVCAPQRRRGAGRAMIDALKAVCREVNARKTWLLANRTNEGAVRFYENTGALAGDDDTILFTYNATPSTGP